MTKLESAMIDEFMYKQKLTKAEKELKTAKKNLKRFKREMHLAELKHVKSIDKVIKLTEERITQLS